MYVVNIVRLRGPIACHRLACARLSTSFFPPVHAQAISTPHSKMQRRLVFAKRGSINYSIGVLFRRSIPI